MGNLIGRVKWYNYQKGYGFVNILNDNNIKSDIFVHFSNIVLGNNQRKSLVVGEYISLNIRNKPDNSVECYNVQGIMGGSLLCENTEYMIKVVKKTN